MQGAWEFPLRGIPEERTGNTKAQGRRNCQGEKLQTAEDIKQSAQKRNQQSQRLAGQQS